eukprot:100121-Chlamydomonas_euryale.AAC.4
MQPVPDNSFRSVLSGSIPSVLNNPFRSVLSGSVPSMPNNSFQPVVSGSIQSELNTSFQPVSSNPSQHGPTRVLHSWSMVSGFLVEMARGSKPSDGKPGRVSTDEQKRVGAPLTSHHAPHAMHLTPCTLHHTALIMRPSPCTPRRGCSER